MPQTARLGGPVSPYERGTRRVPRLQASPIDGYLIGYDPREWALAYPDEIHRQAHRQHDRGGNHALLQLSHADRSERLLVDRPAQEHRVEDARQQAEKEKARAEVPDAFREFATCFPDALLDVVAALARGHAVHRDADADEKDQQDRFAPIQRERGRIRPSTIDDAEDGDGVQSEELGETSEAEHQRSHRIMCA